MGLSLKQQEQYDYTELHNPKISIAYGAVRSGKTYLNIILFAKMIYENKNKNYNFILIGATLTSVQTNVLDDMEKFFGIELKMNKQNKVSLFGNTICCFGAEKEDAARKMRGMTAYGAYVNEVSVCNKKVIDECLNRCSGDNSQIFMDTNPENPNHWVKTKFVDKDGERLETTNRINVKSFHYTLDDNAKSNGGFVEDEYVEWLKSITPKGVWYDRTIHGLWKGAEGLVYDMYDESKHVITRDKLPQNLHYYIGIDYGTVNPCVFLLIGTDGHKIYVIDEYYYSGKGKSQKPDSVYSNDLKNFINKHNLPIREILIDPRASSFIAQLRQDRFFNVIRGKVEGKEGIIPGIKNIQDKLHNGRLFILENCKHTRNEMGMYRWDEGLMQRSAREEPVKEDDHCLDALRYYVHSRFPIATSIRMGTKPTGF